MDNSLRRDTRYSWLVETFKQGMTVEREGRCCPLLASNACSVFVDDTVREEMKN